MKAHRARILKLHCCSLVCREDSARHVSLVSLDVRCVTLSCLVLLGTDFDMKLIHLQHVCSAITSWECRWPTGPDFSIILRSARPKIFRNLSIKTSKPNTPNECCWLMSSSMFGCSVNSLVCNHWSNEILYQWLYPYIITPCRPRALFLSPFTWIFRFHLFLTWGVIGGISRHWE